MLKISVLRRLMVMVLVFHVLKVQHSPPEASRPTLASYERLIPGVTTLVAAEAILGPSVELSRNMSNKAVVWKDSGGAEVKAVFNKSGILISKVQTGLKF